MNPTYLKHPTHGAHVVYDHGALKRCLDSGWTIAAEQPDGGLTASPFPPAKAEAKPAPPLAAPVAAPVADPPKKKPGRPKKG